MKNTTLGLVLPSLQREENELQEIDLEPQRRSLFSCLQALLEDL